jgi:hypothetical protein
MKIKSAYRRKQLKMVSKEFKFQNLEKSIKDGKLQVKEIATKK